jgi:integrase
MGGERKFDGVRASSKSTIEIDFYYQGGRCRERIKLEPTPANLKRAAQHRAAILHAISTGTFDYLVTFPESAKAKQFAERNGTALTIEKHLDTWLAARKPQLKASTYSDYRKIINGLLIPKFGDRPMVELKRSEIKTWAATLTAGNKRIANILSVFRAALQEAFEDELIEANPLAGWSYEKAEAPSDAQDDIDPFTQDEQAAILAKLDGQGRHLVQFAFWTGLRTSELVALDWTDVDFIRGIVRISKASTQAARDAIETTKTRSGVRDVRLLAPALAALNAQKACTFLKGEEIFQNPKTGERWKGDQPIRKTLWTGALKRAGVRYRYPYQTRHTYASMMLSAGEHPMWVAQQMGHSDWAMIRKTYGRWMPDTEIDSGGKAVQTFWTADGGSTPEGGIKSKTG